MGAQPSGTRSTIPLGEVYVIRQRLIQTKIHIFENETAESVRGYMTFLNWNMYITDIYICVYMYMYLSILHTRRAQFCVDNYCVSTHIAYISTPLNAIRGTNNKFCLNEIRQYVKWKHSDKNLPVYR